jgi:hypothetical protein
VCSHCAKHHTYIECTEKEQRPKCANCGKDHSAAYRKCQIYLYNQDIKTIMTEDKVNFKAAKAILDTEINEHENKIKNEQQQKPTQNMEALKIPQNTSTENAQLPPTWAETVAKSQHTSQNEQTQTIPKHTNTTTSQAIPEPQTTTSIQQTVETIFKLLIALLPLILNKEPSNTAITPILTQLISLIPTLTQS